MLKVNLITNTPDPEKVISAAAKLCYSDSDVIDILNDLDDEKIKNFLRNLMALGHCSPLEHATFTFGVEGISRILSHQLVRHRVASYSQKSQRYVKEDQFEYVIPAIIEENSEAKYVFQKAMEISQLAYDVTVSVLTEDIIKEEIETNVKVRKYIDDNIPKKNSVRDMSYYDVLTESKDPEVKEIYRELKNKYEKVAIEYARYVLPGACETKVVFTMNLRSLMNFISQRKCNRAQLEIRELANKVYDLIEPLLPNISKYIGAPCETGKCPEGKMTCGRPIKKEASESDC